MRLPITASLGAIALAISAPAFAGVELKDASYTQGILVHGTGPLQEAAKVTGNLGAGGPTIVSFIGDTDEDAREIPVFNDDVRLQQGQGQADVTGAEIVPGGPANHADLYNLYGGEIFLEANPGGVGMSWIEFGLTSGVTGTIDFLFTLVGGGTVAINDVAIGKGDTHYGFLATNGDLIQRVRYVADTPPGELEIIKQVRILRAGDPPVVPEPGTWAMMLLGFGAVGFALRRRRSANVLTQLA